MRLPLFILLFFFAAGCIRDNKIPKGILPQNEMRKILWDLIRADAYVSDFVAKDSTRNSRTASDTLYQKVFAIHSTTQEIFRKSMTFYEGRPDLLKTVMDSLRIDEKNVQEYQNYIKSPATDSPVQKPRIIKKPVKQ